METIPPYSTSEQKDNKDYLWLHLRDLPYFRSLLRAVEARLYHDIELQNPTLDVGCGDGHFSSIAFTQPLDIGLDPGSEPIHEAAQRGGYLSVTQADGGKMPFPDGYFNSAISNSVLEHIPDVESVLAEVGRVLSPNSVFLFCVPNQNFTSSLSIGRWLDRARLRAIGDAYRSFFNRIARHRHCDPPEIWKTRLDLAGFTLERWWNYYSPEAMQVSEWGHCFGLPSLISRKLTGRWILAPTRWNLGITYRLLKPYYEEPLELENGVCTFYIARRKGQ